jgi:hypothetical protein
MRAMIILCGSGGEGQWELLLPPLLLFVLPRCGRELRNTWETPAGAKKPHAALYFVPWRLLYGKGC